MSRRRFFASSPIRTLRLVHGLTLERVAIAAGLTLTRASQVERFPDDAKPHEISALARAIQTLSPDAAPSPEVPR